MALASPRICPTVQCLYVGVTRLLLRSGHESFISILFLYWNIVKTASTASRIKYPICQCIDTYIHSFFVFVPPGPLLPPVDGDFSVFRVHFRAGGEFFPSHRHRGVLLLPVVHQRHLLVHQGLSQCNAVSNESLNTFKQRFYDGCTCSVQGYSALDAVCSGFVLEESLRGGMRGPVSS